ncbi:UbiX family flavin prenyltransferase [Martelella alba]|uniref:Flavin prenyltransferase UbiX n=1 Tax=Martelella alba TaxID=2590451 RepID=A0A506UGR4_9HYPH|nr:UbiX family flavin prenyltransferase [Martelella alba]TPW32564.1 UbiX family flavin prenyltransferase [Martelella alba]
METKRLIIGISGASGAIYGLTMLDMARQAGVETHLVVSNAACRTLKHETGLGLEELESRTDRIYPSDDVGAAIASGSFKTLGMVVAPCSIRSASEMATGVTSSLLTRAGDVVLKEKRRLVLMVRETPLHLGHLRMLTQLAEIGAVIAPPVPAFYAAPDSLDAMVRQTCGRMLDLFGVESEISRWNGLED